MLSRSSKCEACGGPMYVAEPYERWHEPGSPTCRARKAAADVDGNGLAVVTNAADKQGLALVGVRPRYADVEGDGRRRLVVPRWTLAVYRAFSRSLERDRDRSDAWRVMVHEINEAPNFVPKRARAFEELLEAIGQDEDLKRAIVSVDLLDGGNEAVAVLVEDWAAELGRTKGTNE